MSRGSGFVDPQDIFARVLVAIFGVRVTFLVSLLKAFLEGVRNVLQENQAKDDVLVVRRVHIATQLVRRLPKCSFEPNVRPILGILLLALPTSRPRPPPSNV